MPAARGCPVLVSANNRYHAMLTLWPRARTPTLLRHTFADGWNDRCQPFIWAKAADELVPH
jgi:hypothetical protein